MNGAAASRAGFGLPAAQRDLFARARRLEWWTLAFLTSAIGLLALTMGGSQAMRTAWFEDLLGLVPPIVFLVGRRVSQWPPTPRFPYGFNRAVSGGYLVAASALFAFGLFLGVESALSLLSGHRPTIGTLQLFGSQVWLGWLMIPVLLYTAVVPVILGRIKLRLAAEIYDKVLYADAAMNKADWMTALAAIVGLLGVRAGLWWADSAAALLISLDILRDGARNLRHAALDLLDQLPRTVDSTGVDPVVGRVHRLAAGLPWAERAVADLRVDGHTLDVDIQVVPRPGTDIPQAVEEAIAAVRALDWRLCEVTVTPLPQLPASGTDRSDAGAAVSSAGRRRRGLG